MFVLILFECCFCVFRFLMVFSLLNLFMFSHGFSKISDSFSVFLPSLRWSSYFATQVPAHSNITVCSSSFRDRTNRTTIANRGPEKRLFSTPKNHVEAKKPFKETFKHPENQRKQRNPTPKPRKHKQTY